MKKYTQVEKSLCPVLIHTVHIATNKQHIKFFLSCQRFFKKDLFIFRERGEGREKEERNINVWLPLKGPPLRTQPATQECAPTGN